MKWATKTLHFYVLIYLAIPVVIFWCGWFRWWVAAPAVLALGVLIWFWWSKQQQNHAQQLFTSHSSLFILHFSLIFLAFGWTYLAGVGGFHPQHFDYFKHNLIINNLVRFDWPVRYADGTYLCYYHAYYLPAALLAKIVGGLAAVKYYIFGWTWLGLSLLFLQLNRLGGWKLVIFFMFFGCPEAILLIYEAIKSPQTIGHTLTDLWTNDHNIELIQTPGGLSFPSHVGAFTAVPQHALAAWLTTISLITSIINKKPPPFTFHLAPFLLLILSLYWSPLVTAGLLPFVAYYFYTQKPVPKILSFRHSLILSLFIIIALPALFFYAGHSPMHDPSGWWWSFLTNPHQYALLGVFLALSVGFWAIILWFLDRKYHVLGKDAALIWLALAVLFGISLYRYGHFNDLARRASLPATLVLCWGVFRLDVAWWTSVATKSLSQRLAFYILHFTLFILPLKHHLRWFTAQPYTAIVDKKITDFTPYSVHYLAKYHWGEFDVVAQYLGKANSWYSRYLAPPLPQKTRQVARAFYYWKSVFKLSNYEKNAFTYHKINKLYIKFFDVDWDNATQQAVPKAPIQFVEQPPIEYVPTVFITNRTLEKLTWGGVDELAQKVSNLIFNARPITAREVQIDCDWTPATRSKYFKLLTKIKVSLPPQIQLSVTIRLHQIKFYRTTGVPPVARGMLMYYNMADWKNPNTDNSILDLNVARRYADYISDYPLPLDVVLPIFSWAIVHRNGRPITIINHLKYRDLQQNTRFKTLAHPNLFMALENHTAFGFSVRRGDLFRVEESSVEALQITSALLSQEIQTQNLTFAFYHLDSTNLANYAFPTHKKHPILRDSLAHIFAAFR